jgi:hypothetical protein
MATIYEIAKKYRITAKKLRKLERAGFLVADPLPPPVHPIALSFRKNRRLSVREITHLVAHPGTYKMLGKWREAVAAHVKQAIGDNPEPAPTEIACEVIGVKIGEQRSADILADWIKATLPEFGGVGHAWLGTRLLLGVYKYESARDEYATYLNRALKAVQQLPSFEGWWHVETIDRGHTATIYHRPNRQYDL